MRCYTKRWIFPAILALIVFTGLAGGQDPPAASLTQKYPLDQIPPVDPKITTGKLANGLRYYVRVNREPENRAELRLVVNAGSILEDEDQLGLAHFVEHMAFNGTTHFAKQELVEFLESIGMRFGPDINAYTGFDETVYMLRIPTDSPEIMQTSFQILTDWAQGLTFDPEEIEKERGVIIEEWRLGQGASARMRDIQFPILFQGSRYAERLPVGKKDVIATFSPESLLRFYRDWYRPDLMAVVAVGDFDPAVVRKLIEEQFSGLSGPDSLRLRPAYDVPDHAETLFAVATDKEATATSIAVYFKLPLQDQSTIGDYRRMIVEGLYNGMLNRRFSEIMQKPESPFLMAFSSRGQLIRSKDVYMLSARVDEDGITSGLEALFIESERVARHGFTASELERQKKDLLRAMEQAYIERENQDSGLFAAEYIRNFLEDEPIPGIAYEYELHKHFLPGITLEEINRLGREWITDKNRVILVNAPAKEGLEIPGKSELTDVITGVADLEIMPYEDTIAARPLLPEIPQPGEIISTRTIEELDITEWRLSNGARVVLKPTDFREDQIAFRAFSPGGTSLVREEDLIPAQTAAQVEGAGGLADFSAVDLQKKLSGKVASVIPIISELQEGLAGTASPRDLETLFQMIYLSFTAPRADASIFEVIQNQMRVRLENRSASPEMVFMDTFTTTMSRGHPRSRPLTLADVDKLDLNKSLEFYKDRFADAADFTFVFVGNLDIESLKPLARTYLSSLPATGREESWIDHDITPPRGVIRRDIHRGVEPKSLTGIAFTGPFQYDREHRNALRAAAAVLETRLRKQLREELSGTYGVSVQPSYSKIPDEEYSITVTFGSDPERMQELTEEVFTEIERLKAEGPTEEEIRDIKEAEAREYETNSRQNIWWLSQLAHRYNLGEDPRGLLGFLDSLEKLDAAVIRAATRRYFDDGNYVQVTLYPEKSKKSPRID